MPAIVGGRTYPNEIQRILSSPGGVVGRYVRKIALEIAEESAKLDDATFGKHPFDHPRTGKLKRSYKVIVVGQSTHFRVYNSQKYAKFLEWGTQPHDIKVRERTNYLRFRDRQTGQWRAVKLVRHPGNRAYGHLRIAMRTVAQRRLK